jgi:Fic family protein
MITLKKFQQGKFKQIHVNGEHPIVTLLKKGKNAYTSKEIAKITNMNDATVRSKLRRLVKKGIVAHKSPYYAIKQK